MNNNEIAIVAAYTRGRRAGFTAAKRRVLRALRRWRDVSEDPRVKAEYADAAEVVAEMRDGERGSTP